MAIVTAYITTSKVPTDYVSNSIAVNGAGSSSANRVTLAAGDTLKVLYQSASGSAGTVTISGYSTSYWADSNPGSVSAVNGYYSKASKAGVTIDLTLTLSMPFSYNDPEFGSGSDTAYAYLYVRIGTPIDSEPDPFTFNSASGVTPGSYGYSNTVTITGINTPVAVSATAGAQFSINGAGYGTSGNISNGQTLTVRLVAPTNNSTTSTITVGGTSATFTVISADATPDDFSVLPIFSSVAPYSDVYSDPILVSGLAVSVTASVSGGGAILYKNASSSPATSFSVTNGDRIRVKLTSPAGAGASASCTVTIGTLSRSWTVTNSTASPTNGTKIPIGVTQPPLRLSQVLDLFGGLYGEWPRAENMGAYWRGSYYVPDIPENAGIPTGPPIKLSQYLGCANSFYKLGDPTSYHQFADSQYDGGKNIDTPYFRIGDVIGHGNLKNACQFKYSLQTISGPTIASLVSNSGDPSNYNPSNAQVLVRFALPNNGTSYTGRYRVTAYAQLMLSTNPVLSFTFDVTLEVANGNV